MRVLVVEDHPIVLTGCRIILCPEAGIDLHEATSIQDGRSAFMSSQPDVTVIDINLPDGSGLDLVKECLQTNAAANLVVFSMADTPAFAIAALDAGARGFVSKSDDPRCLLDAVFAANDGRIWISGDLIQEIALYRASHPGSQAKLSEREMQVLKGVARGRSLAEVAAGLGITYKTAAQDCNALRTKLKARTTTELVRIAVEMRLV